MSGHWTFGGDRGCGDLPRAPHLVASCYLERKVANVLGPRTLSEMPETWGAWARSSVLEASDS